MQRTKTKPVKAPSKGMGTKMATPPKHDAGQCPPTPETPVRQRYYLGAIGVKGGY